MDQQLPGKGNLTSSRGKVTIPEKVKMKKIQDIEKEDCILQNSKKSKSIIQKINHETNFLIATTKICRKILLEAAHNSLAMELHICTNTRESLSSSSSEVVVLHR